MEKKPTISVIPTYSHKRMVSRALKSVLAQSYEDFEVIEEKSYAGTFRR